MKTTRGFALLWWGSEYAEPAPSPQDTTSFSSTGLGAARQSPSCHHTGIRGQQPSHVSAGSGQRWFRRQPASEHPSVCKKAQHRAVKLPQTALSIFLCLQPLCESLWQERYALYHTTLFTPSPPSLSQAGFSARSLLVGLPRLWLVAQPQLGLHRTAKDESGLTSLTKQALITVKTCPRRKVSVSWGCGVCLSPTISMQNNSGCSSSQWM